MKRKTPLWGNFVGYVDEDLLAFGLLMQAQLMPLAYYHAVQAIEKYLKALVLSLIDPDGERETVDTQKWLRTHKLVKIAEECGKSLPYYAHDSVRNHLKRFEEFDQATRYPWVVRNLGNGFSGKDISLIADICRQLRNDLPIKVDNYKLGMEVRGYFHGDRSKIDPTWDSYSHIAISSLRSLIPSIDIFVRGWDI